jgi:D-glycero-D-manno-heptose 1,7-bisphosphate phosphatase
MHPALFLDRDGVIIENRSNYVRSWADVSFLPGALEALARVSKLAYRLVIVTNQSVVGREIITQEEAEAINQRLVAEIERSGGRVDGLFMCPHAPDQGCACRKPKPGLLLQAARELSLDLGRSVMIGDALSDIMAGQAAGIPKVTLVRTGRGAVQEQLPDGRALAPLLVYDDLDEALSELL